MMVAFLSIYERPASWPKRWPWSCVRLPLEGLANPKGDLTFRH
jgi:hypothetical protein